MTDPTAGIYVTSVMKIRTRTGWQLVGQSDLPVYVRNAKGGWTAFPGSGKPLNIRTRTGFVAAVTAG